MESSDNLSMETQLLFSILEEIGEKETRNIADLPPLSDSIDVDALTRLAESKGIAVKFEYCGYEILVEDREVTVL
ncbi:HalOD1 output domain-containing protein [Natrialba sp. SSL1]|uniref:HalOD1 output domain-containing protein n=1 Tax=Natrialba sp. SSL1 TaxID=1869245 RepID=UPI000A01CE4A|nr:HalOD1 output domain-containing protein [Natrialba sp. SSL1]